MLINALCLSNYLAPSSCCWADVSDEVSTALSALLHDIAARRFLWTGQVMGWERHSRSLAHGWKDTWLIIFPSCVAWYKVSSRDKTVTLGREVCMGNCLLPFQQGLGPPWQRFLGRGRLAASSPQPVLLPLRKKGLSLIPIIPKSGCEWQPLCKAVMTQALWSLCDSGFVNASKITVV